MNLGNKKIGEIFHKIGVLRLAVLVFAGVVLLVLSLPGAEKEEQDSKEQHKISEEELALEAMEQYADHKEKEVEELLEAVEGIGKVKVMLTLASSEERIPMQNGQLKEEEVKERDMEGGSRDTDQYESQKENVLIQKEGEEKPYVVQIYAPSVEGVAVAAQGAESAEKKKEIMEAIQALFRIEAHKIKVMKME